MKSMVWEAFQMNEIIFVMMFTEYKSIYMYMWEYQTTTLPASWETCVQVKK